MDNFPFIDILIFGMIALFVGLRLYNVLGNKTGAEPKPGPDPFLKDPSRPELGAPRPGDAPMSDNVTPFPGRTAPTGLLAGQSLLNQPKTNQPAAVLGQGLNAQVLDALKSVRRIDPRFDPDQFIAGAGHAYETIVGAFAIGDKTILKSLLDPSVFEGFATAIDARVAAGQTQDSQFVKIHGAEIREIVVRGTTAEITVRFASDMIIVTRDAQGAIVSGSPSSPREVVDLWTFSRNLKSSDPNWLLIATGGAV